MVNHTKMSSHIIRMLMIVKFENQSNAMC